ncbi:MAG: RIP metalloprotease RseP [Candidatus Nomurabacteria bacterium]|nr:RIP metalloprotease RseP [Candidatus Nomurabacteria bacterium]
MNILIFIIILLVLVLAHEWGHFFSAKKFGIRVDEFGFGFPPKITSFKKGETVYSFNALPIGGFVKIYGENPDEENTNGVDANRSMVNKPRWQQAIVLFAGIFMNFVLAWVLFSVGFMSGLPTSTSGISSEQKLTDVHLMIVGISPKSPAEIAGLKSGDKIVSLASGTDELSAVNPDSVRTFIQTHPTNEIEVDYLRGKNNTFSSIKVTPTISKGNTNATIGIAMDTIGILKLPFFSAIWEGLKFDCTVTKDTVVGLLSLIKNSVVGKANFSDVSGPVGLVGAVGDAYKGFGFAYLISFAAMISVNLAVINLFPFPALDGGRLLFLLVEKIKGSRINPKFANYANLIGFGLLMLLMLVVTYHDIVKLF